MSLLPSPARRPSAARRAATARFAVPLLVASLTCAAVSFARAEETSASGTSGVDVALERMKEGRFPEALEAAQAVPADHAEKHRARYVAGEVHLVLGDADAAETEFRGVLETRPDSVPCLVGLGRALLAKGSAAEAVEPLKKAETLSLAATPAPQASARIRAWLGLARSRAGKATEGRKDIAAAQKADPADPEIARVAVEERLDEKDVDGAGKAAAAFAKARKDHPLAPFLQALVLDRGGKFDEAIAAYEKSLAIDATFLDAHKNLAILCVAQNPVYQDAKRTKKAMEHFERYKALGGRDGTVLGVYETLKQFLDSRGGAK